MNEFQMPSSEDLTVLAQAAVSLHEMYRSYVDAGFTEAQSLHLITAILTVGITNSGGE